MLAMVHQYAYFFSLILFILPLSIGLDAMIGFRVIKKLATPRGIAFVLVTVVLLSLFDAVWMRGLGYFPSERILGTVFGVPIEEILLFTIGFYNVGAIFAWAKHKFP